MIINNLPRRRAIYQPIDPSSGESIGAEDDRPYAHTGTFDLEVAVVKYSLNAKQRAFLEKLQITEEEQWRIRRYAQRTPEWHAARKPRITMSRMGSVMGHNPYKSARMMLKDSLWGGFTGNAATQWGCDFEDTAEIMYNRFMRKHLQVDGAPPPKFVTTHAGLIVPRQFPWAGVSVDGLVFDDTQPDGLKFGGLEIKCPFGKSLYECIPAYYYDQIQGSMGFLGLPWWDFVVWTPTSQQIRRVPFNQDYWDNHMFPTVEKFYMTEMLPALVAKEEGSLDHGCVKPRLIIDPADMPPLDLAIPDAKPRLTALDHAENLDKSAPVPTMKRKRPAFNLTMAS